MEMEDENKNECYNSFLYKSDSADSNKEKKKNTKRQKSKVSIFVLKKMKTYCNINLGITHIKIMVLEDTIRNTYITHYIHITL